MENPFGHHHHHHHDEEGGERERPNYPPPGTNFYSAFDNPPPPPPPAATHVTHVHHSSPYPSPPSDDFVHHHHHHDDEEGGERERSNYPPPGTNFYSAFDQPPPPPPPPAAHVTHVHHSSPYPPPPPVDFGRHPPSDSFGHVTVEHVAHHRLDPSPVDEFDVSHHRHAHSPHFPSFDHHHSHAGTSFDFSGKPTVQVYSKAEPNFSLTIRDGKVILGRSDPSDDFQHWYKDEKYSTRVKDEEGFPCFALVNKATGQAMKHSVGDTHPVQLIPYNPNVLDESILWTESKDLGDGYRAIRMVNNIHLNVDAFHGDKHSGGVHDGTIIVLWKWNKGDNQRWKIIRYCKFTNTSDPISRNFIYDDHHLILFNSRTF